ncbi:MAG: hypothetical protein EBS55_03860 [Flavobacteriaceae bacterium]|nr:hypothetical protein [Flavobacteriaceae bacterium]
MLWCYLNSDVIGSYSKITYGLQGDKIAIIGRHNEMVKVLHENGQVFFVKEHLISTNFITKNQNNGTNNGTITKPRNKKRI